METEALNGVDANDSRIKYPCGPIWFIEAKAGGVLADHIHKEPETLWIISGEGKFLVGEKVYGFKGPCILKVPGNVYHKFMPITDVDFIEQRHSKENT